MTNHGWGDPNMIPMGVEDQAGFVQTVTPISICHIENCSNIFPPFLLTTGVIQRTIIDIEGDGTGGNMDERLSMEREIIFAAIESAANELADIMRQLEQLHALQQRARHLEDFIGSGKVLLGEGRNEKPP